MGKLNIFGKNYTWGADTVATKAKDGKNDAIIKDEPEYDEVVDKIYKEIASAILPVVAGRQSIPDHKSIFNILGEMLLVQPEFDVEWLAAIEQLAMWDSDVSAAVDNISLANTKLITTFDEGVKDSQAREMQKFLTESRDKWYNFADGINGWIDDSLTQCAISGALSHEILPTISLDGVAEIVMVSPKNIYFKYVPDMKRYMPVQKVPKTTMWTGSMVQGQYKILNPVTYRYHAMRRIGESPYAVPPFLAAMEGIMIKKDMVSNMKSIINKLGLLGFLKVMLNAPTRLQNEDDVTYYNRLQAVANTNIESVKAGFKNGFMVGFDKVQTIEMQKTDQNVSGAVDLMKMNDVNTMQGLKQHLELMNRQGSTSETFGRVILAKMGQQLTKYQKLTATALSYADLLHLQLAGYKVDKVINQFEPVMLGDKTREAEARGKTIDNARKLWADGVIGKQQYAQAVGYDEPDDIAEEPRFQLAPSGNTSDNGDTKDPSNPSADQNPSKGKTTEKNKHVVLPVQFHKLLEAEPEHGMGFHLVDLTTTKGVFENVIVTNGINAWTKVNLATHEIKSVEIKKKSELVKWFEERLSKGKPRFYAYESNDGHNHKHEVHSYGVPDDEEALWAGYNASILNEWKKTIKVIQKAVAEQLVEIGPNASVEGIINNVIYHVYSNVDKHFLPAIQPLIKDHVHDIYDYYRKSQRPWGKVAKGADLPDAVFNLTDIRAMQFFEASDNLYLGKFITDPDTKAKINQYIRKWYIDNDREIGNSPKAINQFKAEFPEILEGESWKIRRVIDTTVNRMRNTGAIAYMDQAEVTYFKVLSLGDNVGCDYCASLNGKVMLIKTEYSRIQRIVESPPEALPDISPFVTASGLKADDIKQITGETLQEMGIGMPAYHPHCRCTVVIED